MKDFAVNDLLTRLQSWEPLAGAVLAAVLVLGLLVWWWNRRGERRARARMHQMWAAGEGPRDVTLTWSFWRHRFVPHVEPMAAPDKVVAKPKAAPPPPADRARTTGRWEAARTAVVRVIPGVLLVYFLVVIAGLSANGLTGFGRDNMDLTGPWPYLLFFALDGAAGLCAVLQARRISRGETATGPRLAVWGLILASAYFNATHAPDKPGAALAYAILPVVGAVLFEFVLAEQRRDKYARPDRKLDLSRWLHPIERVQVLLKLGTDELLTAAQATRLVRVNEAAKRLHMLAKTIDRQAEREGKWGAGRRAGKVNDADKRAQKALTRAGATDPYVMVDIVRAMQLLTQSRTLATLDYTTPREAEKFLANLMVAPPPEALAAPPPRTDVALPAEGTGAASGDGDRLPAGDSGAASTGDDPLAAGANALPAPNDPLRNGAGSGGGQGAAALPSPPAPPGGADKSGAGNGGQGDNGNAASDAGNGAGNGAGNDGFPGGRLGMQMRARALWDEAVTAGGPLPQTADLMQVSGAKPSTARNWRAAWIKEPAAAALDSGAADVPEETAEELAERLDSERALATAAASAIPSARVSDDNDAASAASPAGEDAASAASAADDDSDNDADERSPALV
ncbi:DUF2637 domain-containing protein [Nonomuraea turkmeniaca]|uniref:DUF2637 domain-containing protein n=1 Tax=Nonomuraea turkmeniaca TaxID=103838 RepID=A0A5S4G808_9ACTN|nr:DUF2637 domain-containing protein [Nonomuraea turkmeniaca]TMR22090.1 DUF2637 domain-containing protein [Nonomuraea turkmeniaca]